MPAIGAETVVYVDMLGFKALVGNHLYFPDGNFPPSPYRPDPELSRRYDAFVGILESQLNEVATTGVTAAVFSDSAFIRLPPEHNYRRLAASLMRAFIQVEVPVRMGIGSGTFSSGEFATRSIGQSQINVSRFYGGAVTTAYEAESCGAKGMRILISPVTYRAFEYEHEVQDAIIPPVPERSLGARVEVNYLHTHALGEAAENAPDRIRARHASLSKAVRAMREKAPPAVHIQYDTTLSALDRMLDLAVRWESARQAARCCQVPSD